MLTHEASPEAHEASPEAHTVFWLPGKGIGKARPRANFITQTVYMPENYTDWKDFAIDVIKLQMRSHLLPAPKPCRVECQFINFWSSDSDNLVGSVMDSLVKAEYMGGDSSSYVNACRGEFVKIRKKRNQPKVKGILVKIFPTKPPLIELPTGIDFEFWAKCLEDSFWLINRLFSIEHCYDAVFEHNEILEMKNK